MNRIQKLTFNNEEDLSAAVYRFGLRNKGKKLVIVSNNVLRAAFVCYLRARNMAVGENRDIDGFCVYKQMPSTLEKSKYGSMTLLNVAGEEMLIDNQSDNVFYATFDYCWENEKDYWTRRDIVQSRNDYPRTECVLLNEELKPVFLQTFAVADEEIDLVCPWINTHVVNENLIALLQQALSRRVRIKITYGIGVDTEDGRQKTSEKTVEMLKTRFSGTNLLKFHKGNTHIKCLICDDKYMMIGSYNFLSFTADYVDENERDEGMAYILDRNQILELRRKLFSWN